MKKQRKHYTPEEKVAILRRHLVEGVPISDLSDPLPGRPKGSRRPRSRRSVAAILKTRPTGAEFRAISVRRERR